jgi:hypothetical protein
MATSFQGWGSSWLDSWGPVTVDPNAMVGSASFSFAASLQVGSGEMQGSASFRIDAILGVGEPRYSQEVELSPRKKWYVKRKKQILVFDTAEDADSWVEAEEIAQKMVEKAQKTSRLARKRVRQKIFKPEPIQTIELDALQTLADKYNIGIELPNLIAQQDYERVMQIMAMAWEMQDEDDIEMLLLA